MSRLGRAASLFTLALILTAVIAAGWAHPSAATPRLLVLVVFDQMRGDYLSRWSGLFGPDGFRRLTSEGAWFNNCHYPYAVTVTGVGHASLGTGCLPSQHGIIENNWYDRRAGQGVYCATLEGRFRMVPAGSRSKAAGSQGGAPSRLLEPTVGDAVKQSTGGRGKVIGISMKDRGGVLPTGARADICYWYDDTQGTFVTSNYYADHLPAYMTDFNRQKYAERWFAKDWSRLRPDIDYLSFSSPDATPGEAEDKSKRTIFPHDMAGADKRIGSQFYNCVYTSPFGNDLTWAAAKAVIENEHLGQDDDVDYLAISYSSNDAVGHMFGPDSQEVLDITLRSDLIVADMIRFLDEHVGRDHYLLALSADHGICPLPEIARANHPDAARIDPKPVREGLEAYLNARYGTRFKWVEAITSGGIYLRDKVVQAAGRNRTEVEDACRTWLLTQPYVQTVYTRSQLLAATAPDSLMALVRGSFHPERSPDVMPVFRPYVLLTSYRTGTSHGSPHEYDTHVPLVLFGSGVTPQVRSERIPPQAAAAILTASIGQRLPHAIAEAPAGLFKSEK